MTDHTSEVYSGILNEFNTSWNMKDALDASHRERILRLENTLDLADTYTSERTISELLQVVIEVKLRRWLPIIDARIQSSWFSVIQKLHYRNWVFWTKTVLKIANVEYEIIEWTDLWVQYLKALWAWVFSWEAFTNPSVISNLNRLWNESWKKVYTIKKKV